MLGAAPHSPLRERLLGGEAWAGALVPALVPIACAPGPRRPGAAHGRPVAERHVLISPHCLRVFPLVMGVNGS